MNKTANTVLRRVLPLAGMLLCYAAVGQNVTVQGRVVDQTGEAIPGANVVRGKRFFRKSALLWVMSR